MDWAEAHYDISVLDDVGGILGRKRIPDTLGGVRALHELLGEHAEESEEVSVRIERAAD